MAIKDGAVKEWNDEQKSASIEFESYWIGYDDKKALEIKTEYALKNCLGGIMVWVSESAKYFEPNQCSNSLNSH